MYDPADKISPLTDGQQIVLIVLSGISGSLSILGSCTIVYKVLSHMLTDGSQQATPYDRIMLGLSSFDMMSSVTYIIAPFLLPLATSQRVWAVGSDSTCSVLGVLFQLSFAAVAYNTLLSLYYLGTVRFGLTKQWFVQHHYVEVISHVSISAYFLIAALLGLSKGMYGETDLGMTCWINDYPRGCEMRDDCITIWGWVFGGIPILVAFLLLPLNNIIIYCYVRNQLSRRATFQDSEEEAARSELVRLQIREVATQGLYYVFSFLICYIPLFVLRAGEAFEMDSKDEGRLYPLLVCTHLFAPLQGLFNAMIYNRPHYVRVRGAYPDMPMFNAMRMACLSKDIPRLSETTLRGSKNTTSNNNNHIHPKDVWKASNGSGKSGASSNPAIAPRSAGRQSRFSNVEGALYSVAEGLEENSSRTTDFPPNSS